MEVMKQGPPRPTREEPTFEDDTTESSEEATRAALRTIVEELDGIRARLEELHTALPPEETATLTDEVEMDFVTQVRSVIECILNDSLRPAIRDLAAAASYNPKAPGST